MRSVTTPAPTAPAVAANLAPRTPIQVLRYGASSLATAAIDNLTFDLVYRATGTIAGAQAAARATSLLFNYGLVRRLVFHNDERHRTLFPRYLLLVVVNALISYAGIRLLTTFTPLGVMPSKILAETLLFVANFLVQRNVIFKHRPA